MTIQPPGTSVGDPAATLVAGADGALLGGRYRLGELLGVGGSAAVYEADDLVRSIDGRHERVAVKVLHAHLCSTDAARDAFLREAERARRVRHPNVVAVRGSGVHDAGGVVMAWIALDLAVGSTLSEWVGAHGPLGAGAAAAVMDGVLAGLGAAHDAGLVHRDVSPRNVVLDDTAHPGTDEISAAMVRILDFGLADVAGRTTVGTGVLLAGEDDGRDGAGPGVVGNVNYISPEQALGRPVTAAGDLYQAGGLLYFLLTGRPPYPRSRAEQVIEAHLSAPAPVPSALVPSAQPLDRVVTRALAKEPGRRFADATQFRAAIRDALPPRTARTPPVTGARPAEPTPTRVLPLRSGWEPGESTSPTATHLAPVAARPAHGLDYLEPSSDDTAAGGVPPRTARPAGGGVLVAGVAIAAIAVLAVLSAFAPTSHPQEAPTPVWTPTPAVSVSASPTATRAAAVRIIVPTLHGTLAEVESALKAAGLTLGQVSHLESAEPSGTVLGQKPDAGAAVARGTAVNVQLASGSNIVPPVAGLSAAAAVAALQSAGFTVAADTPILAGTTTVLGTEPAEGTVLRLGVTVTLVLDAGFATPTPTPSGSPTATASP